MSTPADRLAQALRLSGRKLPALVAYFTAGYPGLDATPGLLLAAQRAGCAAVEVGIPFSDPLADGPTIQRSSFLALRNGMTVARALDAVRQARGQGLHIPVVLMTYINPVLAHGLQRFAADAAGAGAEGVILPDVPLDEAGALRPELTRHGLALVPLVAPTTPPQRLRRICESASGFVYCVGVVGVTGARDALSPEAVRLADAVASLTELPRALGFGISAHQHLRLLAGHVEAVVMGSALIDAIDRGPDGPAATAERYLAGLLEDRAD